MWYRESGHAVRTVTWSPVFTHTQIGLSYFSPRPPQKKRKLGSFPLVSFEGKRDSIKTTSPRLKDQLDAAKKKACAAEDPKRLCSRLEKVG